MNIRKAEAKDLDIVIELNYALFLSDERHFYDLNVEWPRQKEGREYFAGVIDGSKGVCFVAELDGDVVGYLAGCIQKPHATLNHRCAELENMFVKEAFRSKGAGGLLVDAFIEWCKQQNADRIVVGAYTPNTRAIAFYKNHGFSPYTEFLHIDLRQP